MNDKELLERMSKAFTIEANNFRLELERYLSEGLIQSTEVVYPVVQLLQTLLLHLIKQLQVLDRMI